MKKIICLFLIFSLCLLCGCRQLVPDDALYTDSDITGAFNSSDTEKSTATSDPDDFLIAYLDNINKYYTPVRQVGEPISYVHYSDSGVGVEIIYPETAVEFLDSAIEKWVNNVADEYISSVDNTSAADDSDLHILYDSYRVNDSVISVRMSGYFISPALAHPVDIIKVFIADTQKNALITVYDVIRDDLKNKFINKVAQLSQISEESMDDKILDNAVLTDKGIEITFNRGDYFAMSEGTKVIAFEYSEISEYLKDSFCVSSAPPSVEDTKAPETDAPDTTSKPETEPPATTPPETLPIEPQSPVIDPSKPMIALTFDDGPGVHTDRLLDILDRYGVKATFFVIGYLIDSHPEVLQRIADEGHEIGSHSWDHKQLTTLTEEELIDQIMMTRAKIYETTGVDCSILRPPYGKSNDFVKSIAEELGISFVNWSVDTLDWKTKDAQAIYDEIVKNAKDGSIVLCHDLHSTTVDAMELVIPMLITEGYQIVTVSELLSVTNPELVPGNTYFKQ